jgi:hypothetical protein
LPQRGRALLHGSDPQAQHASSFWNNSFKEGNYWSNYTGNDLKTG